MPVNATPNIRRSEMLGVGHFWEIAILLVIVLGMLLTRGGREALAEGATEGCLDAILGGLFGG